MPRFASIEPLSENRPVPAGNRPRAEGSLLPVPKTMPNTGVPWDWLLVLAPWMMGVL